METTSKDPVSFKKGNDKDQLYTISLLCRPYEKLKLKVVLKRLMLHIRYIPNRFCSLELFKLLLILNFHPTEHLGLFSCSIERMQRNKF